MAQLLKYLQRNLGSNVAAHLIMAAVLFFATLALGWILKGLLSTAGKKLTARADPALDDRILDVILPRVKWIATVVGAYLAVEEIAKALSPANTTAWQFVGYARGLIFVAVAALSAILTVRIADTSLKYFMQEHAKKTASGYNEAIFTLTGRIIKIAIAFFAIITVLGQFGVNVGSLLVFLGGGSVAFALAAQETLSNMIAGFLIMVDRPFRVGDRIRLPNGEVGDVYQIGLRSTKILDFDNNLIISPNADLIRTKVINYSYPETVVRVVVDVGIAYGTDLGKAKSTMIRLAGEHPDVLKQPAPDVFVIAFADSALSLQLVARTHDYKRKFFIETTLREKIYEAFIRQDIRIPLPQRVVHLVETPDARAQDPKK